MNWVSGLFRKKDLIYDRYETKTMNRALCNKPHCGTNCTKINNNYKYWVWYFSRSKVNPEDVIEKIDEMPYFVRFQMYLKSLGGTKPIISSGSHPDDGIIVSNIIGKCRELEFADAEIIFKIYKSLMRYYDISSWAINVIVMLLELPESNPEGVHTILYYLLRDHGLSYTSKPIYDMKIEDIVFEKILFSKKKTFIHITDLVVVLGLTYKEAILEAIRISKFQEPNDIIRVLSSKGNIKYYNRKEKVVQKDPEPKTETYFDFLIIQNELIKAQENIKIELTQRIQELENQNMELKISNENLRKELDQKE